MKRCDGQGHDYTVKEVCTGHSGNDVLSVYCKFCGDVVVFPKSVSSNFNRTASGVSELADYSTRRVPAPKARR